MRVQFIVLVVAINVISVFCQTEAPMAAMEAMSSEGEKTKVKDTYQVKVDSEASKITIRAEIQMPPSLLRLLTNQTVTSKEVNGTVLKSRGSFGGITMTIPIGRNVNISILKKNQFEALQKKKKNKNHKRVVEALGRQAGEVEFDDMVDNSGPEEKDNQVEAEEVVIQNEDLDMDKETDNVGGDVSDKLKDDDDDDDDDDQGGDDDDDNDGDDDDDNDDEAGDDEDEDEEERDDDADEDDDDDDDEDFNTVSEYQNRRRYVHRQKLF